jgi:hypothetical protein
MVWVRGRAPGRLDLLGARSSAGGCGGTVDVLAERGALDDVDTLIRWEAVEHASERRGRTT